MWLAASSLVLAGSTDLDLAAEVATLPNGLLVAVATSDRTDTVALHLRFAVGSGDERPSEYGCAHLFEHLMFEGSQNVPGDAFDRWLTAAGGANNAWTSEDATAYHETFPSGALDRALFLESDRLGFLDAGLVQENLANQQDVVLQERAEGYAEPNGRDYDALTRVLWPEGHPYHVPIIGTVDAIRGFTLDGVRDFWQRHYRTRNAVLVIAGNVQPEAAFTAAANWFQDVSDRGPAPERPAPAPPPPPTEIVRAHIVDDVELSSTYITWRGPATGDPDALAVDIAMRILSGGRGTRLDDPLFYEHDRTTDIGTWYGPGRLGGPALIAATSAGPSLKRIEAIALKQVARLGRTGPTDAELARARASLRSDWASQIEGPEGRAEVIAQCLAEDGTPNCLQPRWERAAALTPDAIAAAVRRWLDPQAATILSVLPSSSPSPDGSPSVVLP